jgi:hypothetical protein
MRLLLLLLLLVLGAAGAAAGEAGQGAAQKVDDAAIQAVPWRGGGGSPRRRGLGRGGAGWRGRARPRGRRYSERAVRKAARWQARRGVRSGAHGSGEPPHGCEARGAPAGAAIMT